MKFTEALRQRILFFDGGMGTMIQATGISGWNVPEELNFTHPDAILNIHREYLKAGADIVTANTFGANAVKMNGCKYCAGETIHTAVSIAKEAARGYENVYVAADIGPTGHLLEPMGSLTFDEAYRTYKNTAESAEQAGADIAVIETMSDLYEMKAALLAVKENTQMPVVACCTFQENDRTLTGADVQTVTAVLEGLNADVIGFNCGGGLEQAVRLAGMFLRYASVPVIAQPNAGIPEVRGGQTVFTVEPEEFAAVQYDMLSRGTRIAGGCCGTTPRHIAAMTEKCRALRPVPIGEKTETCVSSFSHTVVLGGGPVIIGERINPTGKKKFREALLAGNMQYLLEEGAAQVQSGAHILDVNVGLPGIDEAQVMTDAVRLLQRTLSVPLQIDSSEPAVLDRALRYYNGKALVNSVSGKQTVMDAVFPVVKKYGGAVVALLLDERGIPETAEGRLAVAERIIKRAAGYGIARKNIVFDALTLTVSSRQEEAAETLKTVSLIKERFGLCTVLGVSNISFGLPAREIINSHFLSMALYAGLDACIINPLSQAMMNAFYAFRALSGDDKNCLEYIDRYADMQTADSAVRQAQPKNTGRGPNAENTAEENLRTLIIKGFRDRSAAATEKLLETTGPLDIINSYIVPALDEVGRDFEAGKKFLPQLLLSADTVSKSFAVIKKRLEETGQQTAEKGTILLATVYGDIHDIGKNIVKAMLENYGYRVIDMGKNVPAEDIVRCAVRENIRLVGLSALMTTTVASMEETIRALRAALPDVKIMAGGAVLTPEYAAEIGADFYAKDAMASVAVARSVFQAP